MKGFFKKYWFYFLIIGILFITFKPLVVSRQIPFSSNLLVSFFNPWAQEKFPGWIQGIPNKPVGIDDLRIFYPQRKFTLDMLRMGQLPLWNPYNYSGNFHAGLSETAVFYPLFFLFLLLPQMPSWVLLQIAEPILAVIGMYLFLRLFFSSRIPAVFGAIVFGFSGVVLVRMVEGLSVGHTLVWLPFAFYGIQAFSQKRKLRYLCITTVALCLSLLAGWFQYAFYAIVLSFFYSTYIFLGARRRWNLMLFTPFLLLPLLTLFHIVPSFEMLQVGSRSATTTRELLNLHLMPWYHLLTYMSPDFWGNPGSYNFFGKSEYKESVLYIGLIPLFISLFSLGLLRKKTVWFFVAISVIGMLLGIDTPISRAVLSLPIPIVSSFLPNRVFILATFGLSVLSAFGIYYLYETKKISKKLTLFIVVVIVLLFGIVDGYAVAVNSLPHALEKIHPLTRFYNILHAILQNLIYLKFTQSDTQVGIFTKNILLPNIFLILFIFLLFLRNLAKKKIFIVCIFLLTIVGQLYFAQKYIPWSSAEFVFPQSQVFSYLHKVQGIDRFITLGQGYISSDIPLFFGLYSPDGVGSMYIKRYGELVTYVQNKGKTGNAIPRIEIRINPSTKPLFSNKDLFMLRFMQIDGVEYVVKLRNESTDLEGITNAEGTKDFFLVWQDKTWQIFKYTNSLPRVFWTNKFKVLTNDNTILQAMFDPRESPQRLILEKQPLLPIDSSATGFVRVVRYEPQKIILQTHATGNGFIFLSDNFTKDFVVTIDGEKTALLRADYTFRAIVVPKGQHVVMLSYDLLPEEVAFCISALTCVLGIGLLVYFRKRVIRV